MPSRAPLLPLVQKFFEHDPVAAAQSLELMDEEASLQAIRSMPPALAAQVFRYLQVERATALVEKLPPKTFREVVARMDPQQGAGILIGLAAEKRQGIIDELPEASRDRIRDLLAYPENSAARIMSTEYVALRPWTKVREAVRRIRQLARRTSPASYVYVIDEDHLLTGVVTMRDLLLATGGTELAQIMRTDVLISRISF